MTVRAAPSAGRLCGPRSDLAHSPVCGAAAPPPGRACLVLGGDGPRGRGAGSGAAAPPRVPTVAPTVARTRESARSDWDGWAGGRPERELRPRLVSPSAGLMVAASPVLLLPPGPWTRISWLARFGYHSRARRRRVVCAKGWTQLSEAGCLTASLWKARADIILCPSIRVSGTAGTP
jgi:hypothetical protein